ncbi:MAG: hypothetical protein HRT50_01715 [Colwellia sp.]|uniref:hypothetical protein n=1 Tax=Colwellia sp. TaxID=56799 RepID=UPI001DF686A4|nr:hypothetical protein [Colwellia sp.]NQY47817.1 hypothetical protein [Colwellia sp.]
MESPGAANKRILQFTQVYRRTSADGTSGQYTPALSNKVHPVPSCADSALFIIPDEYT